MDDPSMRSREEIVARLRELHGENVRKQMGGLVALREAEMLAWVLGYNNPQCQDRDNPTPRSVDVSDYVDVDDS